MTREVLPNGRCIEHFDLQHGNHIYQVGVGYRGRYPDGKPKEIFIDAGKAGTDLRTTVHDLAVAVSIALQHGATIEEMRHTFARDDQNNPAGIMALLLDHLMLHDLAGKVAAE